MAELKENETGNKNDNLRTYSSSSVPNKSTSTRLVPSIERTFSSPQATQFTIRKSVDSSSFEIVTPTISDQHLEVSISNKQTPSVKLNRIESPTKSSSIAMESGLDPIGIDLISQALPTTDASRIHEFPPFANEIIASSTPSSIITTTNASVLTTTTPPKISREFRLLQQSTNSSKVLSNFLETSDTPRRRKPTHPSKANELTELESEAELGMETDSLASFDTIRPLKCSPLSHDSDSTIVLQDDDDQKRRKSVSRSRSRPRSRTGEGRKKSIFKQFDDEMAAASEKEETEETNEEIDDILIPPRTFENRAPNPPPKPGWDSFCFKCHADNAVLSLACSKCKCSYHRACVRPNPIPKNADEFVCPECRELEFAETSTVNKFGHPKIDPHMMKEMLMTILETIRGQPERDFFEIDIPFKPSRDNNQPLIITQMSYRTIEQRIMTKSYQSTEAFIHDMKQLEHNWTLVDKDKIKTLKAIIKYIIGDINEMESCIHCYASAFVVSNWFSAACKRPHLLIWAKLKGYPYWPAKVMSIDVEKQQADVRFFGAHDRAYIPAQHCIIFCEKDPNKNSKGTPTNNKKGIVEALKETEEYIQNIKSVYGFEYSTTRESLEAKNYQVQLERQLPKLKLSGCREQSISEKENESVIQKEKLTLKIVRTSDSNQKIADSRSPHSKQPERERHPLYRVLSKPDVDTNENETQLKVVNPIIIRRNTREESLGRASKRSRLDDTASETSESNLSTTGSNKSASRKRPMREPPKRSKSVKNVEKNNFEPERSVTPKRVGIVKNSVDPHVLLLEEVPTTKLTRRQRVRSIQAEEAPLIVSVSSARIPAGTDEIHTLRETSPVAKSVVPRTKNRSRSFHRSRSNEKDPLKGKQRRMSAHASTTSDVIQSVSLLRRPSSHGSAASKKSRKKSTDRITINSSDFAEIVIKSEPVSDVEEEIMERNQITVNDIAEIMGNNNSGKHKTILISTSDNSDDSYQGSRARKSFPNSLANSRPASRQSEHSHAQNAMVRIPQVFPMEARCSDQHQVNGNSPAPLSLRRQSSRVSVAIERRTSIELTGNLPRLVPKPTGVFTADGSNFQLETGAVSALFSENAHRMTDYFKSLLVDTIGAVSSGIPTAEITLLRLETERLKLQIQKLKTDSTVSTERLKKEHMEEIRILRSAYEEKLKKYEENAKLDLQKTKTEIRALCEIDKQRAIDALKKDVKKTTWCSSCLKEARFYCCWNTSYCGVTCQREHWSQHQGSCRNSNTVSNPAQKKPTAPVTATTAPQPIATVTAQNNFPSNATVMRPSMARNPLITSVQTIGPRVSLSPQHQQTLLPPKIVNMPLGQTIVHHILPASYDLSTMIHPQQQTSKMILPPPLVATNATKKALTNALEQKQHQQQQQHVVVGSYQSSTNSPKINIIASSNALANSAAQHILGKSSSDNIMTFSLTTTANNFMPSNSMTNSNGSSEGTPSTKPNNN